MLWHSEYLYMQSKYFRGRFLFKIHCETYFQEGIEDLSLLEPTVRIIYKHVVCIINMVFKMNFMLGKNKIDRGLIYVCH